MQQLPRIVVWSTQGDAYADALRARLPETPVEVVVATDHDSGATDPGGRVGAEAEVLLAWKVPPGALAGMPRLRWVQVSGAGVDHFLHRDDLRDDVLVTRSLGRFGIQVAEYVVGYLLHELLGIERYRERQPQKLWEREERPLLADRTVGVIGLGSLGLPIARSLAALGTLVLGARHTGRPVEGIEEVFASDRWRDMLPHCDALVIAAPKTADTIGMVDAAALAALRPGAILVNVARGDIVDETALLEALDTGTLGTAILDVFATEPLPQDSPLWQHPRARITPHIAAPNEVEVIADEFAENYRRFVEQRDMINTVDRERGY
jgi:phosphoglycerate dehydrogenase-like enzyme